MTDETFEEYTIRRGALSLRRQIADNIFELLQNPPRSTGRNLFYDPKAKGDCSGRNWENAFTTAEQVRDNLQSGDCIYVAADSELDLNIVFS